jgi:hypothetical protein
MPNPKSVMAAGTFAPIPAAASPQIPGVELAYAFVARMVAAFPFAGLAEPRSLFNVDK